MRSSASPTISFGLISIPTKAYLGAASENFSFNRITPNGNRVKQKLVDAVTGDEVQQADCSKGFEYEKDKFITFTDEQIDSLAAENNNSVQIREFVSERYLNPYHVEKYYYLAPEKGAEKSYLLLALAMGSAKVAVAKWYVRGKDNLVVLKSDGNQIIMFQMYYMNEVRECSNNFSDKSNPSDEELKLAKLLVERLTSHEYNPSKYEDEFSARLRSAVDHELLKMKQVAVRPGEALPSNDMASLLGASLKEKVPEEVVPPPPVKTSKVRRK